MLFKDKICSKCFCHFDSTNRQCPNCGETNSLVKKHTIGKGYISISWLYQLLCFVIGTAGLFVLSFITILLFELFIDNETAAMVSDFTIYGLVFCGFVPIIAINAKKIFPRFAKIKPYLIGIGIGIAIIAFSMINSKIIGLFDLPETVNENELRSRAIIDTFPVLSVIVLGIIGPICEEITYRLGMFSFVGRVNRVLAYIVTSLVFALMHMDFSSTANFIVELLNLPSYIFAGVAFCFAYDKFSLPCSLTAHWLNNLFAVISQIIFSNIN